jgi:hypothetical protein
LGQSIKLPEETTFYAYWLYEPGWPQTFVRFDCMPKARQAISFDFLKKKILLRGSINLTYTKEEMIQFMQERVNANTSTINRTS